MSDADVKARVWYADGLRFSCVRGCRRCCGGFPGHVWVTEDEVRALAGFLRIPCETFRREYVRAVGPRLSLRERADFDCVLLGPDGCLGYPVRPQQCRDYPFWPEVVSSRKAWETEGGRCPGIGQGRTFSASEIGERLRDQEG